MPPTFVRGTDELVAGRVVTSHLAPGSGIVRKAQVSVGVRFIPLTETPESLKKLRSIAPWAYYVTVKPLKRMPYITAPTKMIGYDYLIIAGVKVAYKSAEALHQNKKALILGHGVFRGFKPGLIAKKGLGVPFHPGAAKYYKKAGLLYDSRTLTDMTQDLAGERLNPFARGVVSVFSTMLTLGAIGWAADVYTKAGLVFHNEQFLAFMLALAFLTCVDAPVDASIF